MQYVPRHRLWGINALRYAVIDPSSNYVVSLHQHPDAAGRFAQSAGRTDLEVVEIG